MPVTTTNTESEADYAAKIGTILDKENEDYLEHKGHMLKLLNGGLGLRLREKQKEYSAYIPQSSLAIMRKDIYTILGYLIASEPYTSPEQTQMEFERIFWHLSVLQTKGGSLFSMEIL